MKVAIVTNKMIIGGVEKALINLLKKKKYGTDIDYIFLMFLGIGWIIFLIM